MKHENTHTYTSDTKVQDAPDVLDPFRDAASSALHILTADREELWQYLQFPILLMTAAEESAAMQDLQPFAARFLSELDHFTSAEDAASKMEVGERRRELERLTQLKMRLLLVEYELTLASWTDRCCQTRADGSASSVNDQ